MPTDTVPKGTGNQLVDGLPAAVRSQFKTEARQVDLDAHQEILAQGARVRLLYFPCTAVVSLMIGLSTGQRAEFTSVGREGVVGLSRLLGMPRSPAYAVVQLPGAAWAVEAAVFEALRERHAPIRSALRQYTGYAYRLTAQSAICAAHHGIDQRLARWLLATRDRAQQEELAITHEQLSHMVGATRPRLSEAAARLREAGAIDYRTGRVTIVDGKRLEGFACECYRATRLFH